MFFFGFFFLLFFRIYVDLFFFPQKIFAAELQFVLCCYAIDTIVTKTFKQLCESDDEETCRCIALLLSNLGENPNSHELLSAPVSLAKCYLLATHTSLEVVLNTMSFVLKV